MAVGALEFGNMNFGDATGAVLKLETAYSSTELSKRYGREALGDREVFSVRSFIADAESAAHLEATARGCTLSVLPVDATLAIRANRALMQAALANLLQNAFKFTHGEATISLNVFASQGKVHIEVHDHCGGLPVGNAEKMFTPFTQRNDDRSGLGLGLAIARNSVEADFGTLTVRDVPGTGCVFTIALPLQALRPSSNHVPT